MNLRFKFLFLQFIWWEFLNDPERIISKIGQKTGSAHLRRLIAGFRWCVKKLVGTRAFEELRDGQLDAVVSSKRATKWAKRIAEYKISEMGIAVTEWQENSTPHRSTSKDLRVLFYLMSSLPHTQSGYTLRTHEILKALVKMGVPVKAVTRCGYPVVIGQTNFSRTDVIDGVEYCRILPDAYNSALKQNLINAQVELAKVAQEFNPTIIHTTTEPINAAVVSKVAADLGLPWVYEVRGEPVETWVSQGENSKRGKKRASSLEYRARKENERLAIKAAPGVVFLSETSRNYFNSSIGVLPNTFVLKNSVDSDLVKRNLGRSEARIELGGFDNCKYWIGSVSAIVGYEGFEYAVRALSYLPKEVGLLLVGSGSDRQRLKMLAAELGLDERIRFVGSRPREEAWKWYKALDVFLVPRKNLEVCRRVTPLKAQLALAFRIPVVASDLPALREITMLRGFYFEPENAKELAQAVVRALRVPPAREDEWADQNTWDYNCSRLVSFYGNLIKN